MAWFKRKECILYLIPCSTSFPEKLIVFQLAKKIWAFIELKGSLNSLDPVLSQVNPVHTLPHTFRYVYFNIPHPSTPVFKRSPPFVFNLFEFLSSYACYMSLSSHSPSFYHPEIFGEQYKLWSSSLRSLLHPHATSGPLALNILLSTLFSNTFNL
jgi:hypothetical protein